MRLIDAEEYNNGWIACSERLPEDFMGFEYLTVKRNHTGVNISYFCAANHKWYESRNSKREVDVVMWHDIPLPQPYKENENGKYENECCGNTCPLDTLVN